MRNCLQVCSIGFVVVCSALAAASVSEAVNYGYAGMSTSDTLVVFDLDTGIPLSPSISLLPEGDYPYDVTMSPSGEEVWVVGAAGDGVVVVETTGNSVSHRIPLGANGEYPVDIVFGLGGLYAYVSARDSDSVVVFNAASHSMTGSSVPIVTGYLGPGKMAVNPANGLLYVLDWYDDELHVVDPVSLDVVRHVVGDSLWDLVVDPSATTMYITDRGTDKVHVLNVDDLSPVTSIAVGNDPWGIDLTPDGALLFVANEDSHDVTVIDTGTNTVLTTIALTTDADPRDIDISFDGATAYVPTGTVAGDDGMFVIDVATLMVVDTLGFAGDTNSNAVAVAPEAGNPLIFADDFESGNTAAWN